MPKREFDIRALAKRIRERREQHNRAHPEHPVPIDDTLSRILEHDEEYAGTRRHGGSKRKPLQSPGIAVLVSIAESLGTTVGDLLGERAFSVSPDDRRQLRKFVVQLIRIFELLDPALDDQE